MSIKVKYPSDNEKISTLSPTLKWNTIPEATYELQLSKNHDDVVVKESVTTDEPWIIYNLKDNTTYYWRVRYIKGYSKSDWSPIVSFTVDIIKENLDCYGFGLGINDDYKNIMQSNPHFIKEYNSSIDAQLEIAEETGQAEIVVDIFYGPTIFRIYSTNDTVYMYTDLDDSYNSYDIKEVPIYYKFTISDIKEFFTTQAGKKEFDYDDFVQAEKDLKKIIKRISNKEYEENKTTTSKPGIVYRIDTTFTEYEYDNTLPVIFTHNNKSIRVYLVFDTTLYSMNNFLYFWCAPDLSFFIVFFETCMGMGHESRNVICIFNGTGLINILVKEKMLSDNVIPEKEENIDAVETVDQL